MAIQQVARALLCLSGDSLDELLVPCFLCWVHHGVRAAAGGCGERQSANPFHGHGAFLEFVWADCLLLLISALQVPHFLSVFLKW